MQQFPAELFMSPAAAGFFLVFGLAALAGLAFKDRVGAAMLAVWVLLPPVLAYYTFHEFSFFYPRYLLFTIPAWVLAAAYALRRLTAEAGARGAGAAVLAATLAGLSFASWDQQVLIRGDGILTEFGFRSAAAFIRVHQQPGDAVVFTGYQYAYRGFRYEWRDLPPDRRPREALIDASRAPSWSWRQRACQDPAACLAGTTRIWVVSTDPRGASAGRVAAAGAGHGDRGPLRQDRRDLVPPAQGHRAQDQECSVAWRDERRTAAGHAARVAGAAARARRRAAADGGRSPAAAGAARRALRQAARHGHRHELRPGRRRPDPVRGRTGLGQSGRLATWGRPGPRGAGSLSRPPGST
nr:hypothetical protein GCM10020092_086390 [Actinoplanes digitatis]